MSAGDRDTLTDEERAALVKALAHTPCTYGDLCNEPKLEEVVTSIVAARVRAAQAQALRDAADALDHDPKYHDGTSIITGWLRENADRLDPGDEFQNPED